MAETKTARTTNLYLMFYFLYDIRTDMKNEEEIQKLLQEFESLEQEDEKYTIERDLTLEEIKFLIYVRKNKIDCDELRKKLSNKF